LAQAILAQVPVSCSIPLWLPDPAIARLARTLKSMAMLDNVDLRPERQCLQSVAQDLDQRFYGPVERIRRANAEKRSQLEAKLAAADEDFGGQQEAVQVLHAEIQYEQLQGSSEAHGGLLGSWPEVERAAAAARAVDTKLLEIRRRQHEQNDAERQQLEEKSALYQVFCEATGAHWDDQSEGIEGYVAIGGAARAFEVPKEKATDRKASADHIWKELIAYLPEESQRLQDLGVEDGFFDGAALAATKAEA